MGYLPDYSSNKQVDARWNLVDQTFGTAAFNFNSLSASVIIDNRTVMSQVNITSPNYSVITNPTLPTYTEVSIG